MTRAGRRRDAPDERSPDERLEEFLAEYLPETADAARASRARLRAQLPHAVEMIYDNYNALVMGFSPTERPSDAVCSLAVFPEWVTLCFMAGARLPDPDGLLSGGGNIVRHVRLTSPADLERPAIRALVAAAVAEGEPMDPGRAPESVVRSVSPKRRPRRPKGR